MPVLDHADRQETQPTWFTDRVMATPAFGVDADALADALGVQLLRAPGPSGIAVLGLPEATERSTFIEQLRDDPRIRTATPLGRIYGASSSSGTTDYTDYQWHHDAINTPEGLSSGDLSEQVVAVLDTGVAYETWEGFTAADTLSSTAFTAPYDFINDDTHPNDDNGHGTHIASLIASSGAVTGVAAGVSLMPVKVLDSDNAGDEASLIDGIIWAMDNNADIINLSLTFSADYIPSPVLLSALEDALDSGIVVVAASGNDSANQVRWPAAHSNVIAVGASMLSSDEELTLTDYGNIGLRLDVLAPGGDLTSDHNGDGQPDGMLAESIDPDDPSITGLWWMAGTSQSTALVSGVAARMLAEGASQRQVYEGLYRSGGSLLDDNQETFSDTMYAGLGSGALNLEGALSEATNNQSGLLGAPLYSVSSIPFLQDNGDGTVSPALWMMAYDSDGEATSNPTLHVSFSGSTEGWSACDPDATSGCTVTGPAADADDAPAWVVSVDAAQDNGLPNRPGTALLATDSLEILLAAMADSDHLDGDELITLHFPGGSDDFLGSVSESYVVTNTGAGLADSPIGPLSIILSPALIDHCAQCTDLDLDLEGTGLADSPIGPMSIRQLRGTGLADSPIGPMSIAIITKGNGLADSPIGPLSFLGGPETFTSSEINLDGEVILLAEGVAPEQELNSTEIGLWLEDGGGISAEGYPAASVVQASIQAD